MVHGQKSARIGVRSSELVADANAIKLKAAVMKKHAPRARELAVKILESLKELADMEAEMRTESSAAKFSHGIIPFHVRIFKGLKKRAEELID
jgi:hypothetical protein